MRLVWMRTWILLGATFVLLHGNFAAAKATDNWPCVQRKVPEISLSAVWNGPPLDEAALKWRSQSAVVELVRQLAARRTSEEQARKAIADFARSSEASKKPRLLALIAGLVEVVNIERSEVMGGLERFGGAQKEMATLIRNENAKLSDLRSDTAADPAKVTEATERLLWNVRIFEERQKSLRHVCEVPTLLEQRLFALTREIQKALGEQ